MVSFVVGLRNWASWLASGLLPSSWNLLLIYTHIYTVLCLTLASSHPLRHSHYIRLSPHAASFPSPRHVMRTFIATISIIITYVWTSGSATESKPPCYPQLNTRHWHLAYLPCYYSGLSDNTQTSICYIAPLSTLITTISRVNPIEAQRGWQHHTMTEDGTGR